MKSDQFLPLRSIDTSASVSSQVADHLARLIADGLLSPGDKLPGETVLARRLGVSRPTLREALGVLSTRGLVEVRPRSGTYVCSIIPSDVVKAIDDLLAVDPRKLWELLEVRRVVDVAAAAMAAERRSDRDLEELEQIAASVAEFDGVSLLWRGEGMRAYTRFFAVLARSTGNTLFSHLAGSVGNMLGNALRFSRGRFASRPEAAEAIRDQINAILEAVSQSAPHTARHATLAHLDYVERTLRELVESDDGRE